MRGRPSLQLRLRLHRRRLWRGTKVGLAPIRGGQVSTQSGLPSAKFLARSLRPLLDRFDQHWGPCGHSRTSSATLGAEFA